MGRLGSEFRVDSVAARLFLKWTVLSSELRAPCQAPAAFRVGLTRAPSQDPEILELLKFRGLGFRGLGFRSQTRTLDPKPCNAKP